MSELEEKIAYQDGQIQALTKLVDAALRCCGSDRHVIRSGLGGPTGTTQPSCIGSGESVPFVTDRDVAILAGWDSVMKPIFGD